MKTLPIALLAALSAAGPALAVNYPIFAAECMGGVNQGGYNIDTDDRGHLWVNGNRVELKPIAEDVWEGAWHGVVFGISSTESGLIIDYTARHGANGLCEVVAQ